MTGRSGPTRLVEGRRGSARAALPIVSLLAFLLLAGCGGSTQGAKTDDEKASDVEYLNVALAQELTALDAYAAIMPRLKGRDAAIARRFLAHGQEYADAITKAIRGLGGEVDAEAGELELAGARSREDPMAVAYEVENAALASDLEAPPHLFTPAPRTLFASLAAGHAQHLVVLRQSLGAGAVDSVPEGFDSGEIPPPVAEPPPDRG